MANPTTNYGWVMPNSADLVTDLPADFAVFGQGVDTSMQYLLGGTTGQVLSKTSATNMAFTWTTPTDQVPLTTKGDLFTFTTVDARLGVGSNNQTLYADSTALTGLAWGASAKSTLTTTGDILYASAANTPARLGIGTTGQSLVVAAGIPSWATPSSGSLTLLSTTTLSGASTTISSISGAYKNLQIEAVGVTNSTADGRFKITPNASTTITDGAGVQLVNTISISFWDMQNFIGSTQTIQARANADNATLLNIYNYSSTTDYKNFNYTSGFLDTGGAQRDNSMASGTIKTVSAITSIKFENTGGNFAGGTVRIYGVN